MFRLPKTDRRVLPSLIACALLVGGAMWASTLLPAPAPAAKTPPTAPTAKTQTIGVWEGKVARFEGGDTPAQVYDVAVASLPEEVRQALEKGIPVSSEEELTAWLDNLTS